MPTDSGTTPGLDFRTPDEPFTSKAPFESWGRYPNYNANVVRLRWQSDYPAVARGMHNGVLPVGMGRSYGDVCLLKEGNLLVTTGLNRLIDFDPGTGLLTAEAGTTLAQILDFAVPRGFSLPVTPGTKYITLGGAIANDVHGRNHRTAGTFGCHVTRFELLRSDGERKLCSRTENPDFYAATIGGLGLTGLISWAQLRLKPIVSRRIDYESIQLHGIDEFFDLTRQSRDVEYIASRIDCASTGRNFARGVFMQGDHSTKRDDLRPSSNTKLALPFDVPGFALNRLTSRLANAALFHKQIHERVVSEQDYEAFFYPLDKVLHWNRIYGRRGLLQFQCAIPGDNVRDGITALLKEIAKSGATRLPASLGVFGDVPSPGLMSFPLPGITLALDFPIKSERIFTLFERLGEMTREFGGRLYPAKDAVMTAAQFQAFYPQWRQLARYRDPQLASSFWERVTPSS
jgi:FAD/FMN-containing dehydrogenase